VTLPFHPLADCFPLIEGREYQDLVDDIRKHGLRESIVVHEGQILDGRNRYRACLDADMPYHVKPFGAGDPVAFVISINLRRRHMDESQRAVVAARLENLGHGQRADLVGRDANLHLLPEPTKPAPVTRQQAAELLNVSPRSVAAARTVIDHAIPDLTQKVERGEVSVSAAADVARLPEPAQQEIIAKGAAEILKAAK
jgi:ParB/Sulfiredoxin domain